MSWNMFAKLGIMTTMTTNGMRFSVIIQFQKLCFSHAYSSIYIRQIDKFCSCSKQLFQRTPNSSKSQFVGRRLAHEMASSMAPTSSRWCRMSQSCNSVLDQTDDIQIRRGTNQGTKTPKQPTDIGYPYKNVYVMSICWEEDDSNAYPQLEKLTKVFKNTYHFYTLKPMVLPPEGAKMCLDNALSDFLRDFSRPENLLVVYYIGHGGLEPDLNPLSEFQTFRMAWSPYS